MDIIKGPSEYIVINKRVSFIVLLLYNDYDTNTYCDNKIWNKRSFKMLKLLKIFTSKFWYLVKEVFYFLKDHIDPEDFKRFIMIVGNLVSNEALSKEQKKEVSVNTMRNFLIDTGIKLSTSTLNLASEMAYNKVKNGLNIKKHYDDINKFYLQVKNIEKSIEKFKGNKKKIEIYLKALRKNTINKLIILSIEYVEQTKSIEEKGNS